MIKGLTSEERIKLVEHQIKEKEAQYYEEIDKIKRNAESEICRIRNLNKEPEEYVIETLKGRIEEIRKEGHDN